MSGARQRTAQKKDGKEQSAEIRGLERILKRGQVRSEKCRMMARHFREHSKGFTRRSAHDPNSHTADPNGKQKVNRRLNVSCPDVISLL